MVVPKSLGRSARLVGGFFELQLPNSEGPGLLDAWLGRHDAYALFENARSAIFHVLKSHAATRVWLPAYLCADVADASLRAGAQIAYFPLGDTLEPDLGFLAQNLRPGDFCLAVDYFGRDPGREFRQFVAGRADIDWIEDRAHAWSTGFAPWGRWVVYSPRKLIGVPDGGVLIDTRGADPAVRHTRASGSVVFMSAVLARFEDRDESRNAVWHAASVRHERAMRAGMRPMSRLSETILRGVDASVLATRRRANYRILQAHLGEMALFGDASARWVPSGFPIRIKGADRLWKRLCAQGIFAQRHWTHLPSPARAFKREHRLARELVTLPCDHRYGTPEMMRIVAAVREAA